MPQTKGAPADRSFPELARAAIDELSHLVSAQGRLLRLEMAADAQKAVRRVAGVAVFAPLFLVGYALVLLGVAHLLSGALGLAGALLLIGGLHAGGAGIGLHLAIKTLSGVHALGRSREEIKLTVDQVAAAAAAAPGGSHGQ